MRGPRQQALYIALRASAAGILFGRKVASYGQGVTTTACVPVAGRAPRAAGHSRDGWEIDTQYAVLHTGLQGCMHFLLHFLGSLSGSGN